MNTIHWYAGIIVLTLALVAHAVLYRSSSRYDCVNTTHQDSISLCVDRRSGSVEYVFSAEVSGRTDLAAIRWRVGTDESATVHRLPLVNAMEKK